MRTLTAVLAVLAFVVTSAMPLYAENDAGKAEIKKLLELSGAGSTDIRKQMARAYSRVMPDVPDEVWPEIFGNTELNSLMESLIAHYESTYSQKEIKELIKFFSSPAGQKYAKTQDPLRKKIVQSSKGWAKENSDIWAQRLRKKGYTHPAVTASNAEKRNRCINNLRMIDASKDEYSLEYGGDMGAIITPENVSLYVKGGYWGLECPDKGKYTIHPLGQDPTCTVRDHSLRFKR